MSNITGQELNIIKYQMESELTTIKKYKMYSSICTDPQLKTKFEQIASKHQKHFTSLLNLLES